MSSCLKYDCTKSPGRPIYLKFRHNVSKRDKRRSEILETLGERVARVLAASLMAWAKKPPPHRQ